MKNVKSKKEKDSKEKIKKLIESIVNDIMEEKHFLKEADGPVGAFINPLSDIVKTAKYGLKKVATVGGRNALKLAGHAAMLLIPFIDSKEIKKIDKIVQKQIDARVSQLDNEYKDVLERNIQALRSQDISALTFFLNPAVYFGTKAGLAAASAAASMFEIMTMGSKEAVDLRKKIDMLNSTNTGWNGSKGNSGGGMGGMGDYGGAGFGGDYGGDGLYEAAPTAQPPAVQAPAVQPPVTQVPAAQVPVAQAPAVQVPVNREDKIKQQVASEIARLLKNPKIQQTIKNNPIINIVDNSKISAITSRAEQLMKLKSYDELKTFMGEDFEKFQAQNSKNIPKNLKPEELVKYNNKMVPEIKKAYKQIYLKYLNDMLNTGSNAQEVSKAIQIVNSVG
jgi:hypothetical protein